MNSSSAFVIVAQLIVGMVLSCHAQLLHPSDMAMGRWQVSLHRKDRNLLESMAFPLQMNHRIEASEDQLKLESKERSVAVDTTRNRTRGRRRRRLDCELTLDGDGTFTLTPPASFLEDDTKDESEQSNECIRQPLRGYWILRPNPYCVTDRQYDTLTLKSIPKVRINPQESSDSDTNPVKEQITLEMHCKVWGRYGSNTIRHLLGRPCGKDAGRLTHGTLSVVKIVRDDKDDLEDVFNREDSTRRVLCATFKARHI